MKLKTRIRLIPRNNWDYGFKTLIGSISPAFKNSGKAENVEMTFQQEPIFTNSGRTSLYAILKALKLPEGAQIGVPLFCCSVVFNAICQANLSPRFLDSDLGDCNLAVDDLRKKRPGLAAIVAVHMFGNPCDMDAINGIAGDIPVIEDCAQSIFSTYHGTPTGLLSGASFFSFRCGKYLSAGEGSAIFCREPALQKEILEVVNSFDDWSSTKMLFDCFKTYGKASLYNRPWFGLIGYPIGTRLDKKLNLTAKDGFETGKIAPTYQALVNERIARFQEKINLQREHAQVLLNRLEPGKFSLPAEGAGCTCNWFQFALRFEDADQRDRMADYLFEKGIDTARYLDSIVAEAHTDYGYRGDCPKAEQLAKTILLVPIYYTLHVRDIEYIASCINQGTKLI